jgi:hypothetical protein
MIQTYCFNKINYQPNSYIIEQLTECGRSEKNDHAHERSWRIQVKCVPYLAGTGTQCTEADSHPSVGVNALNVCALFEDGE